MIGRCSNSHVSKAVEWSTSRALTDHLAQMNVLEMIRDRNEPAALLTEKEREVLVLLGQGMTNKEIAARLSRSPNTIKIHVSHILEKLNLRSRTEAALTGFNFGDHRRSHM
jgi:two-component system, NarL family, response regulator DevR